MVVVIQYLSYLVIEKYNVFIQ